MISPFAAMCVPERTLQNRVTGHHMYMTFATHVFNTYTHVPGAHTMSKPQRHGRSHIRATGKPSTGDAYDQGVEQD